MASESPFVVTHSFVYQQLLGVCSCLGFFVLALTSSVCVCVCVCVTCLHVHVFCVLVECACCV